MYGVGNYNCLISRTRGVSLWSAYFFVKMGVHLATYIFGNISYMVLNSIENEIMRAGIFMVFINRRSWKLFSVDLVFLDCVTN